jgi:hypothetical protein
MIVKIKPVPAKVNVSRQNGELETTGKRTDVDHISNLGIYVYNHGAGCRFQVSGFKAYAGFPCYL